MGNAEHTLDRTNGAPDTGTDDATDRTAHRAGNTIAFIGAFLGAAHDALGVARLGQTGQGGQNGGGGEEETERQTSRP